MPILFGVQQAFAQAVGHQAKDIDGKVCKKQVKSDQGTAHGYWSCIDAAGGAAASKYNTFSKRFGVLDKHNDYHDGAGNETPRGWPGTASGNTKTADAVATDLGSLTKSEKGRVAGLLSKTISGATVGQACSVSGHQLATPFQLSVALGLKML